MTEIETFLFRSTKVHWVHDFLLEPPTLRLAIAPFQQPDDLFSVSFAGLTLISEDRDYCDAIQSDLELPWDIIGFDSSFDGEDFWRFCLHTDGGEWCFRSRWPIVA